MMDNLSWVHFCNPILSEGKVSGNGFPSRASRKGTVLQTPWQSLNPKLCDGKCVFSATTFVASCYSSNGKLIHSPKQCFQIFSRSTLLGKKWIVHFVLIDKLSWFSSVIAVRHTVKFLEVSLPPRVPWSPPVLRERTQSCCCVVRFVYGDMPVTLYKFLVQLILIFKATLNEWLVQKVRQESEFKIRLCLLWDCILGRKKDNNQWPAVQESAQPSLSTSASPPLVPLWVQPMVTPPGGCPAVTWEKPGGQSPGHPGWRGRHRHTPRSGCGRTDSANWEGSSVPDQETH